MCLGFAMPDNFRFPYAAVGFSDFWRRWHITLSSWLRDYLYIPLGGNRHGEPRALPGPHGHDAHRRAVARRQLDLRRLGRAAWSLPRPPSGFCAARFAACRPGPIALLAGALSTYALINVTWVFFRAKTFGKAWQVLRGMVGANPDASPTLGGYYVVTVSLIVGSLVAAHW